MAGGFDLGPGHAGHLVFPLAGQDEEAHNRIEHLGDPVPQLSLTKEALALALKSSRMQKQIAETQASCK